jgi:hypothetical protein
MVGGEPRLSFLGKIAFVHWRLPRVSPAPWLVRIVLLPVLRGRRENIVNIDSDRRQADTTDVRDHETLNMWAQLLCPLLGHHSATTTLQKLASE